MLTIKEIIENAVKREAENYLGEIKIFAKKGYGKKTIEMSDEKKQIAIALCKLLDNEGFVNNTITSDNKKEGLWYKFICGEDKTWVNGDDYGDGKRQTSLGINIIVKI